MKLFNFCKTYVIKEKKLLILFSIVMFINWIISIATPYISGKYLDVLITKDVNLIVNFSYIFIAISIVSIIIMYIGKVINVKYQSKVSYNMISDLINHLSLASYAKSRRFDSAYLSHRISNDSNVVSKFFFSSFITLIVNLITYFVILAIIFNLSIIIFLVIIALTPFYFLLYRLFRDRLYESNLRVKENQNKFFANVNERIKNIKIIKLIMANTFMEREFSRAFDKLCISIISLTKIRAFYTSCDNLLSAISRVTIFIYGGIKFTQNEISIGEFSMLNMYFNNIVSLLNFFVSFSASYQESIVSFNRISELLNIEIEKTGTGILKSINTIELKNISFKYPDKVIIDGFSFLFSKGNIYCIIGQNGVGKSTLLDIICGIYNEEIGGDVFFNNLSIKQMDTGRLRAENISILPQWNRLFSVSLKDNILLGSRQYRHIPDNLFEDILNVHANNNEPLAEDRFSGGEKQKILILRVVCDIVCKMAF